VRCMIPSNEIFLLLFSSVAVADGMMNPKEGLFLLIWA
jgi:hypothetical protein